MHRRNDRTEPLRRRREGCAPARAAVDCPITTSGAAPLIVDGFRRVRRSTFTEGAIMERAEYHRHSRARMAETAKDASRHPAPDAPERIDHRGRCPRHDHRTCCRGSRGSASGARPYRATRCENASPETPIRQYADPPTRFPCRRPILNATTSPFYARRYTRASSPRCFLYARVAAPRMGRFFERPTFRPTEIRRRAFITRRLLRTYEFRTQLAQELIIRLENRINEPKKRLARQ